MSDDEPDPSRAVEVNRESAPECEFCRDGLQRGAGLHTMLHRLRGGG